MYFSNLLKELLDTVYIMSKKHHCAICNVYYSRPKLLEIHCETLKQLRACKTPCQENKDNLIESLVRENESIRNELHQTNLKLDQMKHMLTRVLNQTKTRVKSQEHQPEKQPEGLVFNEVIMTDLIEGLGDYKINKELKDPENSEGLFDLNPEAISDEHGHRRWTELFCNLKKETNYDSQLQVCSEFVLDHFSSEEDFFIECENPPRLRFIKGVGDKKQWESKEHSKKCFNENLKLIVDLIQHMDEQYGKFIKHHGKSFESLDVHDVINTGFSIDYLYDKHLHKEF